MTAEVAYDNWKKHHKVDMMVRTDFQMFEIGYNIRQAEIDELTQLIFDMEKEHKRLNSEVLSLKRKIKSAKKENERK